MGLFEFPFPIYPVSSSPPFSERKFKGADIKPHLISKPCLLTRQWKSGLDVVKLSALDCTIVIGYI